MPQSVTITGFVRLSPESKPLPFVTVEIWSTDDQYGRLASCATDANGAFSVILSPAYSQAISEGGEQQIKYNIYENGKFIVGLSSPFTFQSPPSVWHVELSVPKGNYDAAVPVAPSDTAEKVSFIDVKGTLTDKNGLPLPDCEIHIFENGFRNKTLVGRATTNVQGQYTARINANDLTNTVTNAAGIRSLGVEAVNTQGMVLAVSGDIFKWDSPVVVDLKVVVDYVASTSFDHFNNVIQNIVSGQDLASLKGEEAGAHNEIRYVAMASGISESEVATMVQAHKHGADAGLDPAFMYAILKAKGTTDTDVNPVMQMKESHIREALDIAVESNHVQNISENEIRNFVEGAKSFQIAQTRTSGMEGEDYTLDSVLLSVLGTDDHVNNFLHTAAGEYEDTAQFWQNYSANYGQDMAQRAQKGMQLATITGYQPAVISHLMDIVGQGGVHELAKLSRDEWKSVVHVASDNSGQLAVPVSVRGDVNDIGNQEIKDVYANRLADIVQNIYPMSCIAGQLQAGNGPELIGDDNMRNQAITFINNNPTFDPRIHNVADINGDDHNLSGVDAATVKTALEPFQRVMRITAGMPEGVGMLITDGLNSAKAIAELDQDEFVRNYAPYMGEDAATAAYSRANTVHTLAKHYAVHAATNGVSTAGSPVLPYPTFDENGGATAQPTLSTIFGSLDYCTCDQCMSMYSPAAYYTDILNKLRTTSATAYYELMNRRPDLKNIDLTCKNTNTVLPYIDLVNELLEGFILVHAGVTTTPFVSFQTQGTPAQLAAYPEHVYKDSSGNYQDYTNYTLVYENTGGNGFLNNAIYPNILPFSLATEEARAYLQYLGMSRHEAMQLFEPYLVSAFTSTNELTDYYRYSELLGLTKTQADIIAQNFTSTAYTGSANNYLFYGFPGATVTGWPDPTDTGAVLPTGTWYNVLTGRVDVLLQQAGISYGELLQMLITDFLNKIHITSTVHRDVNIVNIPPAAPDTCQLRWLQLSFIDTTPQDFLAKLYRFVRLYRTGKLSIYQWDILLRSFNITSLDSTSKPTTNGNATDMELIGRAIELSERLNISPEYLAAWWSNLDTTQYIDYDSDSLDKLPSVYSSVFDNKGVINDPNYNIFSDPGSLAGHHWEDYTNRIAAFCMIGENELVKLLTLLGINMSGNITITGLSRVYIITQIAASVKYSIDEMIAVFRMSEIQTDVNNLLSNPPYTASSVTYTYTAYLDMLEKLANRIDAIKETGIDMLTLDYIVSNVDAQNAFTPETNVIESFYNELRSSLLKLPLYNDPGVSAAEVDAAQKLLNQLLNVTYQQFSKEFNVPASWVQYILDGVNAVTTTTTTTQSFTMKIVKDTLFRSETAPLTITDIHPAYDDRYRLVHKIVLIADKLRIRPEDFKFLYADGLGSNVTGFNFTTLYVAADATSHLPLLNTSNRKLYNTANSNQPVSCSNRDAS